MKSDCLLEDLNASKIRKVKLEKEASSQEGREKSNVAVPNRF